MPCNGVAVANGRIELNQARALAQLPADVLRDTVALHLRQNFPALAGAALEPLPWQYDFGVADIGFKLGRYLFQIQRNGSVTVSVGSGRRAAGDQDATRAMSHAITELLAGLAGAAMQQQTINDLRAAGVRITAQQRAANGAIVLSVEV